MRRWLDLAHWNMWALLAGLGLSALALAWSSYNLYQQAIANFRLIVAHGLIALLDGGLLQFLQILSYAILSLVFYIGFRGIESEIIDRWRGKRSG